MICGMFFFFLKQGCRIQSSTTSISGEKKRMMQQGRRACDPVRWFTRFGRPGGNHRKATERRSRESLQHSPVEGFMQAWRDAKAAGS